MGFLELCGKFQNLLCVAQCNFVLSLLLFALDTCVVFVPKWVRKRERQAVRLQLPDLDHSEAGLSEIISKFSKPKNGKMVKYG